jgi:hypothetical protein
MYKTNVKNYDLILEKQEVKMKRILFVIVLIFSNFLVFSQDIIYLKDGTEIKAKIIELTNEFVKYKKFEQLDGPLRDIIISKVFMVIYENGSREVFKEENQNINQIQTPVETVPKRENVTDNSVSDSQDLCFKGQQDAGRYYTGYREASTWTAATTILGGVVIGLIPAIACSSSEPQMNNLTIPDAKLFKNSSYYQCYMQEAKRIKSRKVWRSFGIGAAIDVGVTILIVSLSQH